MNRTTIREEAIKILANGSSLTVKSIYNKVRKKKRVSYYAVYKVLQDMTEKERIIKTGDHYKLNTKKARESNIQKFVPNPEPNQKANK